MFFPKASLGLSLVLLSSPVGAVNVISRLSNKCLHIPVADTRDDAIVKQSTCNHLDHYQFDAVASAASDDHVQLKIRHSSKCVGVVEGSAVPGALVIQTTCADGDESQLWRIKGDANKHQLVALHSGMCMNVFNNELQNGADIIQWPCSDTAENNLWRSYLATTTPGLRGRGGGIGATFELPSIPAVVKVPTAPTAAPVPVPAPTPAPTVMGVQIISQLSKKCIDAPISTSNEALVVTQLTCENIDSRFLLDETEDVEYFKIRIQNSDICVGIQDGSADAAARLVHETCMQGQESQLWRLQGSRGSQQLIVKHSGMCMNVFNNELDDGTDIIQWPCQEGAANNQWTFGPQIERPAVINRKRLPQFGPRSSWSGVIPLPVIPVAAANLPDGRILTWCAYSRYDFVEGGGRQTWISIYDPVTNQSSEALIRDIRHDMFCPGTAVLADGRIVITGGNRSEATTIYDPRTDTWSRATNMNIRRGYHSMTMMADGRVFTLGGSWSGGEGNKDGEVYNPTTNQWSRKNNIKPIGSMQTDDKRGVYRADNHMWLFTAPNGKIFQAGPSRFTHWIDPRGDGTVTQSLQRDGVGAMNGNAVMYDIGKILTLGGAPDYDDSDAIGSAHIIDLNDGDNVRIKRIMDLPTVRVLCNSVVLPTGDVIVVGGQRRIELFQDTRAVFTAEIWSPETEEFTTLAPMQIPRTYHSVAILLKDGRVWVGGGGLCQDCATNHFDAEILTPPYLSRGRSEMRPEIVRSTPETEAGGTITVDMRYSQDNTFALVRLSAVTHSINNDGRRIPLEITSRTGSSYQVKIPDNPAVAITGSYFLFAMDRNGIPSIATILRINMPNGQLTA